MLRLRVGEQALDEQRDVLAAVAQSGDLDRDDVEAIEEILAERARARAFAEIAVGRGEDAHVDLALLVRADRADDAALEHVQELRLERGRHLAHLVEEQRAAVGLGEEAARALVAPGERALHVAEELALQERLGERRAVDGDERAAGARARRVDGARERALARAGLADDEHRRLGVRHARGDVEDLAHRRALRDQAAEADARRAASARRLRASPRTRASSSARPRKSASSSSLKGFVR